MGSLFEKLGGAEFVDRVVDNLYVKMVTDTRINPFLVGTDLKEQALQLKMFLTYQLGGLSPIREKVCGLPIRKRSTNWV